MCLTQFMITVVQNIRHSVNTPLASELRVLRYRMTQSFIYTFNNRDSNRTLKSMSHIFLSLFEVGYGV